MEHEKVYGIYRNTNRLFAHTYVHNFLYFLKESLKFVRPLEYSKIGDFSLDSLRGKKIIDLVRKSTLKDKIDERKIRELKEYSDEDLYYSCRTRFFVDDNKKVKMNLEVTCEAIVPTLDYDEREVISEVVFSHTFGVPREKEECSEKFFKDCYGWIQVHRMIDESIRNLDKQIAPSGIIGVIRDLLSSVKEKFSHIWLHNVMARNGYFDELEKPFLFKLRLPWFYAYHSNDNVFKGRDVIIKLDSAFEDLKIGEMSEYQQVRAIQFKDEKNLLVTDNKDIDFVFNCIYHRKYRTWVPFDERYGGGSVIKEMRNYKSVSECFIYAIGHKLMPLLYASIFNEQDYARPIMKDAYMTVKELIKNRKNVPFEKAILIGALLAGDTQITPKKDIDESIESWIENLPEIKEEEQRKQLDNIPVIKRTSDNSFDIER